jgi:hypothetical protein
MHLVLRSLLGLAVAMLVVTLLSPWLIYEVVLLNIDGRPAKPAQMAPAEQQAWVWQCARGTGELRVGPMNPYGVAARFFTSDFAPLPGETLAYWVSREHIWAQPRHSMLRWHLSNAALTIWLTRHWTAEELASALVPVVSKSLPCQVRLPAGAAASQP